ncbi:MAG: hypothetical protein ABI237_06195 [Ginsengibacter sp.]
MDTSPNNTTSDIQNFLTRRLGEKEADEIMNYIREEINKNINEKGNETKEEITLWRNELDKNFATKGDFANLEKKLTKRVSAVEGTIILWGFVFWFTLIIAIYIIFRFIH